jgi:hypothetical protein
MSLIITLAQLEGLLQTWNPSMFEALNPGLTEDRIRAALKKHRLEGATRDIIDLYSWRNGTQLTPALIADKRGMLPGSPPFYLLDLEMALGHLGHARAVAKNRSEIRAGLNFLPLFWDGSNRWIVIATSGIEEGRILSANHRSDDPFHEIEQSLDLFLTRVAVAISSDGVVVIP